MTTQKANFTIRIYTAYGEFLATRELVSRSRHDGSLQKAYDAVKVGSMDDSAYPALENMTFHGDYAVSRLARSIMRVVRE